MKILPIRALAALCLAMTIAAQAEPLEVSLLKNELALLQREFADTHPKVVELQKRIELTAATHAEAARRRKAELTNIEFEGGTLQQVIGKLSAAGREMNVIADKMGLETQVPAFKLKDASLPDVVFALNHLLRPRGLELNFTHSTPEATPVCVVYRRPDAGKPRHFDCYDMTSLLVPRKVPKVVDTGGRTKPFTMGEILSILRDAWQLHSTSNFDQELKLQFHEGTKVLLLSGNPDAVEVAMKTLASLPRPQTWF